MDALTLQDSKLHWLVPLHVPKVVVYSRNAVPPDWYSMRVMIFAELD